MLAIRRAKQGETRLSSHDASARVAACNWKTLASFLLLLLTHAAALRPALAAEEIPLYIQGSWPDKFHDSLRYRRVSATRYPDGRKTVQEYRATIKVVLRAHRDGSAIFSWKYTDLTVNGEPKADLSLEFSVDADGAVELLNADDLQRKVLEEASHTPKSGKTLELGRDELAKMAANKEALAGFYLRDAVMFFYPQGVTVRRDRPVEADGEIPGLGGDTLKVVDRWTVLPDRDVPAGTVAVEWMQDADRRDVERYFSALGKALGVKIDATKGVFSQKGLYALDRTTFWPHLVMASTHTSIQASYEQFDSIELRSSLLDPNWKH